MKFSALRKRLHLSPATVIASLALIFAMSGGAYAAKKYLITSTKQISPSVLKQLQGKAGAAGAPGAAGAQGPAGAAGSQGPAGSGGAKGETGPEGKKGEAGATGPKGAKGETGSPWPVGGTLPEGATETGVWTTGMVPVGAEPTPLRAVISIPIPLAAPIATSETHVFEGTAIPTGCSGTVEGNNVRELKAVSGQFCVWVRQGQVKAVQLGLEDPELSSGGVGTHGAVLESGFEGFKEETEAEGTWAVTG